MTRLDSSEVVRVRLDLSYDGTDFLGWAVQPGLRTIQGDLESALARIVRDDDGGSVAVRTTVAGRTDAGVHARGQVAHVDVPVASWARMAGHSRRTLEQGMRHRLDGVTADDITVRRATVVPASFDARFSAMERRYAYRVCDEVSLRDPLTRRHVLWHDRALDVDALNEAAATLVGLRDFAPFCRPRHGATTVRDLTELSWERIPTGPDAGLVVATVRADAFCHSMVRSLVGALLDVGEGHRDLSWLARVAATGGRSGAVAVAPAHGLTLEEVTYPPDEQLAARALATRARRNP
ncbi:tRNA pseudouridine(38-40) synthase TruA [Demequina muriae]|uniref:tRNA pseudouridine synthase A n=1 Tax=Demequina muriae TaxID=3051664 RepID=A0ABT8GHF2_9MICO|nr:tRNA pseudouridine(38-40) synthase TruA [Demequina sp. EGI L300058]MDN4480863.1 tRNA pseudouridine(38-40) synthase TruA [Demequina sp. EGI L300058]